MKRLWADTKRQGGARIQVIHEMTKLFNEKNHRWYKDKKPPIHCKELHGIKEKKLPEYINTIT